MTLADAKKKIVADLTPCSPSPQLDADCILQWIFDCDRTRLLLRRNDMLSDVQEKAVSEALEKRKTGFPIAYITGKKEFFGLDFYVTPAVLIPKPDTEILVEKAIEAILEKQAARPGQILTICDMCTGSGCVGLSILHSLEEINSSRNIPRENLPHLTCADISREALSIAETNASRLLPARLDRIRFVQSNLFEQIPHTFDIIVTNPPYVPHTEALSLLQDGRSEPLLALDGDVTDSGDWSGSEDGLSLIRRLVPQAVSKLAPRGILLMETGEYNAEETAGLFSQAGLHRVRIERDLSGQMRDVIGEK